MAEANVVEVLFCKHCGKETEHKEIVKQKPSKYGKSKKEQFKAFLEGFFAGTASPLGASIDLLDRYLVCTECGHRILANKGDEFQQRSRSSQSILLNKIRYQIIQLHVKRLRNR